ncbi:hypothetical protein ACFLUE_01070 [Chloroflexota bacterium]
MPGKSRQNHRKFSKKEREKRRQMASSGAGPQPVAATVTPPVSQAAPSRVVPPSASKPVTAAAPPAVKYPFVAAEIRRIGILAGIMLITLVILSLVL